MDHCLQRLYARPAPESLEHSAEKPQVWKHFGGDVDTRSQESAKENDVQPIGFRAPPDEMHQGDSLHDEAPRIEKMPQCEHE